MSSITMTDTSTRIGKDVIESLTTGMYEDSRFIYREYIQNSADQIDKAHESGLLGKGEGEIFITINPKTKTIDFYDNATGIEQDKVIPILRNIAMSTKEKGKDKGFRGIGRLGGLGYCDKLTFVTSAKGETVKSIMVWDALQLRRIIGDRSKKESASEVIDMVTSYRTEEEEADSHYFEVILEGVNNKDILSEERINSYLRMVAPIGYATGFIYRNEIKKRAEELEIRLDEYPIYLNQSPLYKSYTADIYSDKNGKKEKIDEVIDVQFFQDTASDGQLLYWGWYSVSTFKENIRKCNEARGIRVRKANIQIGDDYTLKDLHKEGGRGNHYFFGEVHAVHPDLLPNSRRDNFSENEIFEEYKESLRKRFHNELHRLYYDASKIRNAQKDIDAFEEHKKKIEAKKETGYTDNADKERSLQELNTKREKADSARNIIEAFKTKNTDESPVGKILRRVATQEVTNKSPEKPVVTPQEIENVGYRTDKYTWLPKDQRKLLSKVFGVIENVLAEEMASNLIAKIDESLKKK